MYDYLFVKKIPPYTALFEACTIIFLDNSERENFQKCSIFGNFADFFYNFGVLSILMNDYLKIGVNTVLLLFLLYSTNSTLYDYLRSIRLFIFVKSSTLYVYSRLYAYSRYESTYLRPFTLIW